MRGELHRYQCAAITRGCSSTLVIPGHVIDHEGMLRSNGWRMDYGRWICGHHGHVDERDSGGFFLDDRERCQAIRGCLLDAGHEGECKLR